MGRFNGAGASLAVTVLHFRMPQVGGGSAQNVAGGLCPV
jgi:hypothetical protein